MSFLAELKQRKVFRVGTLYLVVAWVAVQVASIALPAFDAPPWALRMVILLFALGFPLALLLSWALELTPEGIAFATDTTGNKRMATVAAVLVALAFAWYFIGQPAVRLATATTAASTSPPREVPPRSIAVLPLANASGDAGQEFFSDGLSENLIIALSQFEGLTVIGRSSSFRFRESQDDARAIGAQLGVAYLLEGSVQHAGDAVRISAELVRTTDGRALWSQRYDRPYQDLFALQDEISSAVATALKAKLLPGNAAATQGDRPPGGNLAAYDAYLQGKFYFTRGTEQDGHHAIEKLSLATRLDPRYAMAWATLADTWLDLSNTFLDTRGATEGWEHARKAADAALKLAPELGLAHAVRSRVLASVDTDWQGSVREAARAMELAPTNPRVRFIYSLALATSGKVAQAVAVQREGLALDPLDTGAHRQLGRFYFGLGRLDEAEAATRRAMELQPGAPAPQIWLVYIQVLRGAGADALATAQQITPGGWRDTAMAAALAVGPDRAAADAALRRLSDAHPENAYQIAGIHALRGEPDQAFEWLERARRLRDPGINNLLLFDPFLLRYRDDPRMAAFCKQVGLPPPSVTDALGMDQIRAALATQ